MTSRNAARDPHRRRRLHPARHAHVAAIAVLALLGSGCGSGGDAERDSGEPTGSTVQTADGGDAANPGSLNPDTVAPLPPACPDRSSALITPAAGDTLEPSGLAAYASIADDGSVLLVATDAPITPGEAIGDRPQLAADEVWIAVTVSGGGAELAPGLYTGATAADGEERAQGIDEVTVVVGDEEQSLDTYTELDLQVADGSTMCGTLYLEGDEALVEATLAASVVD